MSTAPATPRTANAPAKVTRPLTMELQLIAPRIANTEVSTKSALAATSRAAEPARVPVMVFNPMARIVIAPPRVIRPFATCSQLRFPIFSRAVERTTSAGETITKPAPIPAILFGMNLTATVIAASAPAIAVRPRAISPHCMVEKSLTAEARIFIAAAMAINATPVEMTF